MRSTAESETREGQTDPEQELISSRGQPFSGSLHPTKPGCPSWSAPQFFLRACCLRKENRKAALLLSICSPTNKEGHFPCQQF